MDKKAVIKGPGREIDVVMSYTGHSYDQVLGLYFAQARLYDQNDRRFVAVDPVRGSVSQPMSLMKYVYVLNNPLIYIDPWGLVKINGKEINSAITGKAIDGSNNTYISLTDFIFFFYDLAGWSSGWTSTNNYVNVYGPWPDTYLFTNYITFSNNKGVSAPYSIDVWRVKGQYFVKLNCLTTLLDKARVASNKRKLTETDTFFRPSDWTASKGTETMRAIANDVLENGVGSGNTLIYAGGNVVFKYHKYTNTLRQTAKNQLSDMTTPSFVTQAAAIFDVYSYIGNSIEDTMADIMTEAAGGDFEAWMLAGYPSLVASGMAKPEDVVLGGIMYIVNQIGAAIDAKKYEKGTVKLKDMIARYVYAEATNYRYMMKTSGAGKHFNKALQEAYNAQMSELGIFEAFVPEYVREMKSLYDTIYSVNDKWSNSKSFLAGITINSLSESQWRQLTGEYENMIK